MHSPILKVVAVASIALAVVAGVVASGHANETCVIGTPDLGHWEGGKLPSTTPTELIPS